MNRHIKNVLLVIAGFCWIAAAVVICLFLLRYLAEGAGLQVFDFLLPLSSLTVITGVFHFIGFTAAACVCFAIGAGLIAWGVVPPKVNKEVRDEKAV